MEIHNKVQSGNNHFVYELADSKQVRIKKELNIDGGETVINLNSLDANNKADDTHVFTGFGTINFSGATCEEGSIIDASNASVVKAWINQTGGKLTVEGKTASVGGLNIDQSGGVMNISTAGNKSHSWHILSDFGDSEIKQGGDKNTELNIGGIAAYNSKYTDIKELVTEKGAVFDPANSSLSYKGEAMDLNASVNIAQTGAGTINIHKGIDLNNYHEKSSGVASAQKSNITQSGSGNIVLNGEYKGVTFDITQEDKGGVLNINGDLKTDVVKQNGAGSIVAASNKTLSANNVYAGTVNETLDADGNVTSRDASVEISGNVTLTDGTLKTETSQAGDVTVTNDASLKTDKITVSGDTFVNKGVIVALSSQADAARMMLSGSDDASDIIVVEGGKYVEYVTCEKSILVQEGGTLTLLDGSNVADVTLESGTINVTGAATVGSLTLNDTNSINFNFNGEVAPSIVLTSGDALDLSSTTIKVTVSTEMLENLAGQDFELFGGNVENITNATYIFTDGDADTSNDKIADVSLGSTSGSIKVENVQSIPEPATATLSLLALAGLCARRRRR